MSDTNQEANPTAIGSLIRGQREALHMTVAKLATRVGVSRNTITNYESGKTEPSASDLVRLSAALGCTVQDLLGEGVSSNLPRFAFRAHVPLRKDPEVIIAAQRYLRAYDEIEEITGSRLHVKLRTFDGDDPLSDREIESAADTLRQTSGLHDTGPENIASVLEGLGVRTLFFSHDVKGLEGLSTMQGEMILVLLPDRKRAVERTIFSAAHELGHLVLHPHLFTDDDVEEATNTKRYEEEADKFAGSFLVPSDELVRVWKDERLNKHSLFNALILLKRVFHVSFHCLYRRVTELKLHDRMDWPVFVNYIKDRLGIDRRCRASKEDLEPEPLDPNVLYRTTRFDRLVHSAFLQNLIGVSKVAEMFQVPVDRAKEITAEWLKPKHAPLDDGTL